MTIRSKYEISFRKSCYVYLTTNLKKKRHSLIKDSLIRSLYTLILGFTIQMSHAQISTTLSIIPQDLQLSGRDRSSTTYQLGLAYWTRLKNKRIEFYPSIFWQHLSSTNDSPVAIQENDFGSRIWIVAYPFDFGSDCNCPTFSKQNELLKKGFFMQLSPEYIFTDNGDFSINAGMGLDIGITNLLTVSPSLNYRRTFSSAVEASWIYPMLRLNVRLDKRNY